MNVRIVRFNNLIQNEMIKKLIKKYEGILNTLKENKKLSNNNDGYPYNLDIQNTQKYLKDLKKLALNLPDVNNMVCGADLCYSNCSLHQDKENGCIGCGNFVKQTDC